MMTGVPYRQLSLWEQLWHRFFPQEIDCSDAINNHSLTCGNSGVGKTSKLKGDVWEGLHTEDNMLILDTHKELFDSIAPMAIKLGVQPDEILFIDPTSPQYGHIIIDPLRGVEPYVAVDALLAVCRAIWLTSWGERMADCLRHLLLVLINLNLPLSEGLPFLQDDAIHKFMMSKVNDLELETFWAYFFRYHRPDIESTRNKLSFLLNPLIKPMFDRVGSTIDFYEAFKHGKIVAINLSRNYFKDDSSRGFLAAVLISMVYNALLQRENDKEKRPLMMFLDEVHEYYIPEIINNILTGGRKYGAGLKMYTQSLGHFKPHDLDIIFSTIGSICSFQVGFNDARRLVDEMFTFRNDEIVKHQEHDIFGRYGEKKYHSAGEQRQHALAELMEQAQREVLVRIKKRQGNETYIGRVADLPEFKVSPQEEDAYRRESARHHGYTNP